MQHDLTGVNDLGPGRARPDLRCSQLALSMHLVTLPRQRHPETSTAARKRIKILTALRDLTASAVMMGLLAAFVGYSASFAIVMAALEAMGATEAQAATGCSLRRWPWGCAVWCCR